MEFSKLFHVLLLSFTHANVSPKTQPPYLLHDCVSLNSLPKPSQTEAKGDDAKFHYPSTLTFHYESIWIPSECVPINRLITCQTTLTTRGLIFHLQKHALARLERSTAEDGSCHNQTMCQGQFCRTKDKKSYIRFQTLKTVVKRYNRTVL